MSICILLGMLDAEVHHVQTSLSRFVGGKIWVSQQVSVPEIGDVIFLHLSLLDQKKT